MNLFAYHNSRLLDCRFPHGALKCRGEAALCIYLSGRDAARARASLRLWADGKELLISAEKISPCSCEKLRSLPLEGDGRGRLMAGQSHRLGADGQCASRPIPVVSDFGRPSGWSLLERNRRCQSETTYLERDLFHGRGPERGSRMEHHRRASWFIWKVVSRGRICLVFVNRPVWSVSARDVR